MIINPKTNEELLKELADLKLENESLKTLYEQDNTERKLAEERIRFQATLLDAVGQSVIATNMEGKIIYMNPAAESMFGWEANEAEGCHIIDITVPQISNEQAKEIMTLLAGGGSWTGEFLVQHRNGTVFPVLIHDKPVLDGKGMLIGIIGVSSDITERKCAETALKKLNAELIKSNTEKDKFLSIIAHDLKSPFLGFLGLTQDINKNASNISVQELTQLGSTLYQAADNLFKLLQNLLEWAQMQKGSMSFQPKEFSLSELITENVQTMKKRSEQKEVAIINTVVGSFKAYTDEKMINSVLLNLLSNAVKFTQRNGAVTISVTMSKDQMIEISIGDTGIGMPKNLVEKLFEVGEKTGRKGTDGELSTGLGLLLCKEFVDRNGGKIWVESQDNIGSTFYFTLRSCK